MTVEEYEVAFHGIDLPETLQLFPGVTVTNVPGFIEKELTVLRANNSKIVSDTVKYRLDRALELLNS